MTDLPEHSIYQKFSRDEWAKLRSDAEVQVDERELAEQRGVIENVPFSEVTEVYLPLVRLLTLHAEASRNVATVQSTFLGLPARHAPYVIAVAGSVSVGKSTFARGLRSLLAHSPQHPRVELITSDSFLWPNAVLEERGLIGRKGYPETYDVSAVLAFLEAIKRGEERVQCPTYSHDTYDIVPGAERTIERPDIVIFEGINVLQNDPDAEMNCADFIDFSVYLDAEESDLEQWYLSRVFALQRTAFQKPTSYFHEYRDMTPVELRHWALQVWRHINLANLRENILPTREHADVVLRKGSDHTFREVWLRRA